jgi:hypothetical protein
MTQDEARGNLGRPSTAPVGHLRARSPRALLEPAQ